jgi:putative FmdB family regulatory protein
MVRPGVLRTSALDLCGLSGRECGDARHVPVRTSRTFRIGDSAGGFMPVYDYICNDCHKEFEIVLTLLEHDHQQIKCPKCSSKNVEQEAAAFFAVTSKKS